jgi:hypothetical protein
METNTLTESTKKKSLLFRGEIIDKRGIEEAGM